MNQLWHFHLDKPVAQYEFEPLLAAFKDIIDYAISNCHIPHYRITPDDLRQELAIVLWKCHQKYQHLPNVEFYKIFRRSASNRVTDFVRFSLKPTQRPPLPEEYAEQTLDNDKLLPSDFYERNIKEIFDSIDPENKEALTKTLNREGSAVRGRKRKLVIQKVKELL